ncbi:unnamed protein product [Choristocarpus tenellus]
MLFGATGRETGKTTDPDDDLYEDFNYSIPSQVPGAVGQGGSYLGGSSSNTPGTALMRGAVPGTAFRSPGTMVGRQLPSQMGRMMTGAVPGTGLQGGDSRPMTSVSGAGYQSKKKGAFDPLNQGRGPAPALAEKSENGPEDVAKEMERQASAP